MKTILVLIFLSFEVYAIAPELGQLGESHDETLRENYNVANDAYKKVSETLFKAQRDLAEQRKRLEDAERKVGYAYIHAWEIYREYLD